MTYELTEHKPADPLVRRSYDAFKEEIHMQFEYMIAHDIKVKPVTDKKQPYASSADMMSKVASTNTLHVFLTRYGYGSDMDPPSDHPMLEASDITIDGQTFCFNDLFRAVHDFYCHYSFNNDFSLHGECLAALRHLDLLSATAGRAVFTETVGQICWFYHGTHLFDDMLKLPPKGSTNYLPLGVRPYPAQKAMLLPECLLKTFCQNFA